VVKLRAEIEYVEPAAAFLTFPKMLGFRSKAGRQFACQIFPRRIVSVMRPILVMLMRAIDSPAHRSSRIPLNVGWHSFPLRRLHSVFDLGEARYNLC
jgi:hypothetical protein